MHQGKLNLLRPISDSSGSSASFFTIAVVTSEGPEDVVSQMRLALVIYFSNKMGYDFLVINLLMEASF